MPRIPPQLAVCTAGCRVAAEVATTNAAGSQCPPQGAAVRPSISLLAAQPGESLLCSVGGLDREPMPVATSPGALPIWRRIRRTRPGGPQSRNRCARAGSPWAEPAPPIVAPGVGGVTASRRKGLPLQDGKIQPLQGWPHPSSVGADGDDDQVDSTENWLFGALVLSAFALQGGVSGWRSWAERADSGAGRAGERAFTRAPGR